MEPDDTNGPGSPETDATRPSEPFFVVGIGASAGGLEALSAFLRRVTIDGASFIVVQHLAPTQTSMLTELLGRASRLEVVTAEDGAAVKPNVVYVTPPKVGLVLQNGLIRLQAPDDGGTRVHLPVDQFFQSLAEDRGAHAIGVVLSGTGRDGSVGLAAIKAAGGITFVQDPKTAKFDGMPRSALESGAADFCLGPEAIADEILQVSEHPYLRRHHAIASSEADLAKLGGMLKRAFGVDLTHYKPSTIDRRLQRRMAVHRLERLADYVQLCQNEPKEVAALHRDLLINVTAFFRDGEPFEVLKSQVLARIVAQKRDEDAIRVWVPGCASGEEAYSIAILLVELLDDQERHPAVQIFATDVDGEAISQARRGVYLPSIAATVSPERLHRFFVKTDDDRYQVARRIRDLVVFSTQNVARDAPFSRLDLVSCRNVLIYLQPTIQRKVLRILHYALVPDGFLMLGTSETVGDSAELFSLVDRKNKIYTAKHVALAHTLLDVGVGSVPVARSAHAAAVGAARPTISIAHLAERRVLDMYAPPGVVVNENLDVVYFRGRTAPYLEQPSGVATHDLLRMVRPELHMALKKATDAVLASGEATTAVAELKDADGGFRALTLVVQPLIEPETKARCLLVLFQETPAPASAAPASPSLVTPEQATAADVRHLTQELELTKNYLQSTIEELERTNEDLKSANEELQSANEELQSTNEEHETSKEELQSANEELITVNEELQHRMRDLSAAHDDLHNVLLGVDRPIIIVGLDLRIRRFTQAAERVLRLAATDIGRPVSHLDSFVGARPLERMVADVISNVSPVEVELQAADGRWYELRITPYKTLDLAIRGAVITFVDIEVRKRRHELTRAVDEYAAEFLVAVQHPLVIVNRDGAIVWANEPYYVSFSRLSEEIIGTRIGQLLPEAGPGGPLDKALSTCLSSGRPFRNIAITVDMAALGPRRVTVGGSRIRGVADDAVLALLSLEGESLAPHRDVTSD